MMLIRSSIQLSSNETGLQRRPFLESALNSTAPSRAAPSVVYLM